MFVLILTRHNWL